LYDHIVGARTKSVSIGDAAQVQLDEKNPTYAGLAQEIGFGTTYLCALPWLLVIGCAPTDKSAINLI
jgi:hypothetical protein